MALKDDVLRFRVNGKEKAAIERAAAHEGLSASTWLRTLALRAAGVLPEPKRLVTFMIDDSIGDAVRVPTVPGSQPQKRKAKR